MVSGHPQVCEPLFDGGATIGARIVAHLFESGHEIIEVICERAGHAVVDDLGGGADAVGDDGCSTCE